MDSLDEREVEVLSLLGQGYSASQIHSEFGFDPKELKNIKQQIRAKLRLRDDVALLQFAAKQRRRE